MGKPEDIPQDVWDAAVKVWSETPASVSRESIARAILAERERAAGIIDAANAHYAEKHEAAKAVKNRVEAHDLQTMRIATAGLSNLIRAGA